MTPILIRTKDNPFYLNTTLHSLMGTNLEDGLIVITDNCSESQLSKDFLFTNNKINFPSINFYDDSNEESKNNKLWKKYVGDIPIKLQAHGLKNNFNVIQPVSYKEKISNLIWNIYAGFTLFRNADKIIILNDELVFHKNWMINALKLYEKAKNMGLGCISVYNQEKTDFITSQPNTFFESNNIDDVMYLIPRKVFNIMKNDNIFDNPSTILKYGNGFQKYLLSNDLKMFKSSDSYIQHINIDYLTENYSKIFVQPFAWVDSY